MGSAAGGQGRCERRGSQQGKAAARWAVPPWVRCCLIPGELAWHAGVWVALVCC
jgi:hypothetical protein